MFEGPNDSTVTLYATSDLRAGTEANETITVAVAWSKQNLQTPLVRKFVLDPYCLIGGKPPVCGHALDPTSNLTRVFMLARSREIDSTHGSSAISISIPTTNENSMEEFMMEKSGEVVPKDLGKGELGEWLFNNQYEFDGGFDDNVSVWLGDHRHLILVEYKNGTFYDAQKDTLVPGPADTKFVFNWFLAGRATQDHSEYLDCKTSATTA